MNKVADKVKESGGEGLSKEIRNENDVEKAIEKGRGWFKGHKCLFICDDMWRCKGRDSGYLHLMRRLCNEKDGACVLLSTRDLRVLNEVGSNSLVCFEERGDTAALDILCKYAEVRKEWLDGASARVKDAMGKMLRRCNGLPVALGVAGKGIRSTIRGSGRGGTGEKERRLDAIVKYSEKLERLLHAQIDLMKRGHGDHSGLFMHHWMLA